MNLRSKVIFGIPRWKVFTGLAIVAVIWILALLYLSNAWRGFLSSEQEWNPLIRTNDATKDETHSKLPKIDLGLVDSTPAKTNHSIFVVLSTDSRSIGGVIAVIQSVLKHTQYHVFFCIAVDSHDTMTHLKLWLNSVKTTGAAISIQIFSPLEAKLSVLDVCPEASDRLIYLDSDVIVQHDIFGFAQCPISTKQWGSFLNLCHSSSHRFSLTPHSKYGDLLNVGSPQIKKLHIDPGKCAFDTGVFVIDVHQWMKYDVAIQLKEWHEYFKRNSDSALFPTADPISAAMWIVFYNHTASLDPLWNLRDLGMSRGTRYSPSFISKAHLLHWSGRFKPWHRRAAYYDIWDEYFVADPLGKFKPIRLNVLNEKNKTVIKL